MALADNSPVTVKKKSLLKIILKCYSSINFKLLLPSFFVKSHLKFQDYEEGLPVWLIYMLRVGWKPMLIKFQVLDPFFSSIRTFFNRNV